MKDWELQLALDDPDDPIHGEIEAALERQHVTEAEAVRRFRRLGARRQRLQQANDELAQEIREALSASEGVISKVDAARLLGVDRTLLYKTYLTGK